MRWTTYARSIAEAAIRDAQYSEWSTGADKDAMVTFARCLRLAGGNPYLAERLTQTLPEKGRRLGPDRAEAAKLAYVGALSLDAPGVDTDALSDEPSSAASKFPNSAYVHRVLAWLSDLQREVLMHDAGMREHRSDEELARWLGTTARSVQDARRKGRKRFAALWSYRFLERPPARP